VLGLDAAFLAFASAVAMMRSTSGPFIPRPVSSCRISTENTTSNFFEGSPENTSELAVPLNVLITARNR